MNYDKALMEYSSAGGGSNAVMWVIGLVGLLIIMSAGWYFIKQNMK